MNIDATISTSSVNFQGGRLIILLFWHIIFKFTFRNQNDTKHLFNLRADNFEEKNMWITTESILHQVVQRFSNTNKRKKI